MKTSTKTARAEYKILLETYGEDNIVNAHITEVVNRTGVTYLEMQNASSYWKYRTR